MNAIHTEERTGIRAARIKRLLYSYLRGALRRLPSNSAGIRIREASLAPRTYRPFFAALVCALALSVGCTKVGPDFTKPEAPIAADWIAEEDKTLQRDKIVDETWWTVFDDKTLDRLIKVARGQNLSLQIAGLRVLEGRATRGIAAGTFYPQTQRIGGSVSHVELSDNGANNLPGLIDESYREANLGFQASWELDIWGKFRRGIEAANADLIAAVASYDDVLITLTAEVATAYVSLRTYEQRLVIAENNVNIQQKSLSLAEARHRNGATTELDMQQARALLRNTEATVPGLRIGIRQSKNALSTLLGMPPNDLAETLKEHSDIPDAPAAVAVGIPSELMRRRPDIRRAEWLAAAQSARIGVAKAELYPEFSLVGSVGFRASDTFRSDLSDIASLDSLEAVAGPSFSWNIFNYGRIKNNVRAQDARLQALIVAYRNTVLHAAREVEDAMVGFLHARERIGFLRDGVDAAQRSVDIALLQYRDGAVDYQRVLQTQEALVAQQDLLTATRGSVASNLISMYRALGGGWEVGGNRDIVSASSTDTMRARTDWGGLLEPDETSALEPSSHSTKLPTVAW